MIGKRVSMLVAMSLAFVGVSALDASAAVVVRPRLAVVSARVAITKNCEIGKSLGKGYVTIKNSGGPLAAGMGSLQIREFGGPGLLGNDVNLPAFGAGQEQTVPVSVHSPLHAGLLVGSHRLQVFLKPNILFPQNVTSFDEPAPYNLSVVYPGGHCGGTTSAPRPQILGAPSNPKNKDPKANYPLGSFLARCPDLAVTRIDASIESRTTLTPEL